MTSQESPDFHQEILLERYQVQQELGKKAGRRSLLTRDLQTLELVVVKILSFGNEFEWNDLKLFEREAETLKALSHPAIPRYLNYFELDSPNSRGFALVQSYIPAQSLEAQLKAGRSFSEEEVKELAKAILEILKYLHGRQPPVIHRDIKPSNILLTNRSGNSVGEVYLVDFGSVQTIARRSSTMTVVGSYGYMPPEQFNGRATRASDLYSLGATLIYLVTGQHPGDLPQTDLRIEFEQAANISFSFKNWLSQMTEPIASQRFASVESALQALDQPGNATQTQRRTINSNPIKPPGCKVVLNKSADFIEVIVPGSGFFTKKVYVLLLFIICLPILSMPAIITFIITAIDTSYSSNYYMLCFFAVVLILSTIILVAKWVWVVLLLSSGKLRLLINQHQISLASHLFGIELHNLPPSPREYIIRLERMRESYNSAGLIIWAGLRKYRFLYEGEFFTLTPPELDWLAYELSDWLDLAITKE
ncbi:serine/threonine protein kinase [Nostoc sp. C052]|nr:serine/threonine-protein kinase [Nostoc sp. C052]QLE44689.1 serine/threonine protein kinase [Nostoc sp. C052]